MKSTEADDDLEPPWKLYELKTMHRAIFDVDDLVDYFDTTPETILNLVKTGRIPYKMIGKDLRFSGRDIDQWKKHIHIVYVDEIQESILPDTPHPKTKLPETTVDDLPLFAQVLEVHQIETPPGLPNKHGYVYILKYGKYYKIGKANKISKRLTRLEALMPEESELIHTIQANEPLAAEGSLQYILRDKRVRGDWFVLQEEDIAWLTSLTEVTIKDPLYENDSFDYANGVLPRFARTLGPRTRQRWEHPTPKDREGIPI